MFYCSLYINWNKEFFQKSYVLFFWKAMVSMMEDYWQKLLTRLHTCIYYLKTLSLFLRWIIHIANRFYKGAIFSWYLSISNDITEKFHTFIPYGNKIWLEAKLLITTVISIHHDPIQYYDISDKMNILIIEPARFFEHSLDRKVNLMDKLWNRGLITPQ